MLCFQGAGGVENCEYHHAHVGEDGEHHRCDAKGGKQKMEKIEKYKLVHTHTARRTGATLMYLAGIDIYDIMKVTGHTTPKMLKKYIRAESLEVVEKLTDKYEYFR